MTNVVRNIADIARIAGVSKSTVSRALNGSPKISEATRRRIEAIADEHHFAIHRGAQTLSLQRTRTLALVIPIEPAVERYVTDPFNMALLGAVARSAKGFDYDLLLAQAIPDDHSWVDRFLDAKRVDGAIVMACHNEKETIAMLAEQRAPVILWGAAEDALCSVTSDDVAGGRLATAHLLGIGRNQIAFLGGHESDPEPQARYQGYRAALDSAETPFNPNLIAWGDFSSRSGYEKMGELLARVPELDAVFVNSDVMAIGAMEALRERGRTIPGDVAVVGYDGSPLSAHCSPPLTTIQQRISQAGRLLVENLLRFIDDGTVTKVVLPIELIVRQSSGGAGQ